MAPLATVDQLGTYLDAPVTNTARAEMLLEAASQAVRDYCGWPISQTGPETITVDGSGGRVLQLPALHVTDITAVTIDDVELAPTAYRWSVIGLVKRLDGGCWPDTYQSIGVTWTCGYDPIPASILELVCAAVARRLPNPSGHAAESIGDYAVTYSKSDKVVLSGADTALLDHYRLP
ncbi:hypothetical protein ACWEN6_25050 [Sphaerisporangium sp. NPDC004334]